MKIYDYLQVNSHYVYSKKLDLSFAKSLNKQKVKLKKYDEQSFCSLLESAVFGDQNIYVHIVSKQGEFILTNVTNEIEHNKVQEFLKTNSLNNKTYYFSNVDYFSYGRFGLAENGKITRYLAYNSEVMGDEEPVVWVGKPHEWEYSTHTFYSKKKLEDCEMDFGWDEVCQMAEFYLPFINDDLKITECNLYCEDENYLKELCRVEKKKKCKEDFKEVYGILEQAQAKEICFIVKMTKNNLIIDGQALKVYNPNAPQEEQKVLCIEKNYNAFFKFVDNPEAAFYEILTKSLNGVKDAKVKSLIDYVKDRKVFKCDVKYYLTLNFISAKKFEIYLISYGQDDKINRKVYLGNKLNNKVSNEIYRLLSKWYKEDVEK